MSQFKKRTYQNPGEMLADMRMMRRNRQEIRSLMGGGIISPAFRERIMLAVTAVNGCRYCSFFHSKQALTKGISPEEIRGMAEGLFDGCPEEELPALLYAQHWAETRGNPDEAARAKILETYGEEKTRAIEFAIRMITAGNLMGNTFDYFLHKLSFGLWDKAEAG